MKITLPIPLLLLLSISLVALAASRPFFAGSLSSNASQTGHGPVRMIRFVLLHDGIYPRQMRVDHGLFNIALEDRTDGSDGLVIESVSGDQRTKVTQIKRNEKHWRGRALVRLTPGHYVISNASQPDHRAELIVNP